MFASLPGGAGKENRFVSKMQHASRKTYEGSYEQQIKTWLRRSRDIPLQAYGPQCSFHTDTHHQLSSDANCCKLLCVLMENPPHTLAYNPLFSSIGMIYNSPVSKIPGKAFSMSFFWRSIELHNFNWLLKSSQTSKDVVFLPKGRQEPVRESIWHFIGSCFWSSVQVKLRTIILKGKLQVLPTVW